MGCVRVKRGTVYQGVSERRPRDGILDASPSPLWQIKVW